MYPCFVISSTDYLIYSTKGLLVFFSSTVFYLPFAELSPRSAQNKTKKKGDQSLFLHCYLLKHNYIQGMKLSSVFKFIRKNRVSPITRQEACQKDNALLGIKTWGSHCVHRERKRERNSILKIKRLNFNSLDGTMVIVLLQLR